MSNQNPSPVISNARVFAFPDNADWYYRFTLVVAGKDCLSPEVKNYIQGCIGYAAAAFVRGENPGFTWNPLNGGEELEVSLDLTKSARDDWGDIFSDFWPALAGFLVSGSPERKRKNNTRLFNPLSDSFDFSVAFVGGDL